jgi:hypothetical protein
MAGHSAIATLTMPFLDRIDINYNNLFPLRSHDTHIQYGYGLSAGKNTNSWQRRDLLDLHTPSGAVAPSREHDQDVVYTHDAVTINIGRTSIARTE